MDFAIISKRFHSLITRLIHRRLLQASSLPDKCLIFECYHPSAKISTPPLSCEYIGNKSAKDDAKPNDEGETLSSLHKIYSSFRLAINEDRIRRRRARPDADIDDTATEDVYLDEGELFSQLCAVTYVAKRGPRPGLFLSHLNIGDGVIRVWRDWLAQLAIDSTASESWSVDDSAILWADAAKGVGVRFKVTAAPSERMPLISGPDDHPPVAYTLQYEGMSPMFKNMYELDLQLSELLIRTTKLLLAVEKSAVLEISHSGKAVIIASM